MKKAEFLGCLYHLADELSTIEFDDAFDIDVSFRNVIERDTEREAAENDGFAYHRLTGEKSVTFRYKVKPSQ